MSSLFPGCWDSLLIFDGSSFVFMHAFPLDSFMMFVRFVANFSSTDYTRTWKCATHRRFSLNFNFRAAKTATLRAGSLRKAFASAVSITGGSRGFRRSYSRQFKYFPLITSKAYWPLSTATESDDEWLSRKSALDEKPLRKQVHEKSSTRHEHER